MRSISHPLVRRDTAHHHVLVEQGIHLSDDAGRTPGQRVLGLTIN